MPLAGPEFKRVILTKTDNNLFTYIIESDETKQKIIDPTTIETILDLLAGHFFPVTMEQAIKELKEIVKNEGTEQEPLASLPSEEEFSSAVIPSASCTYDQIEQQINTFCAGQETNVIFELTDKANKPTIKIEKQNGIFTLIIKLEDKGTGFICTSPTAILDAITGFFTKQEKSTATESKGTPEQPALASEGEEEEEEEEKKEDSDEGRIYSESSSDEETQNTETEVSDGKALALKTGDDCSESESESSGSETEEEEYQEKENVPRADTSEVIEWASLTTIIEAKLTDWPLDRKEFTIRDNKSCYASCNQTGGCLAI